jgi:hypothetical protein
LTFFPQVGQVQKYPRLRFINEAANDDICIPALAACRQFRRWPALPTTRRTRRAAKRARRR